jgi:hypothetical protein
MAVSQDRQNRGVDLFAAVCGAVAGAGVLWVEAIFGRYKLRRYVEARGYRLNTARWRGPLLGLRQAQYRVTVERDGRSTAGRAYLGGWFTGPVWSSKIEFDWDGGATSSDIFG